jgi:molybdopterin-containing oxidoreductase family iron-sulfur binding subunit
VSAVGDEIEDVVSNGDETVRLSQLIKEKAGYRFLEELGTKPRVYYLPPANRQFPFKEMPKDSIY